MRPPKTHAPHLDLGPGCLLALIGRQLGVSGVRFVCGGGGEVQTALDFTQRKSWLGLGFIEAQRADIQAAVGRVWGLTLGGFGVRLELICCFRGGFGLLLGLVP